MCVYENMPCIFCQIIENKKPAYKVYEDPQVLAFLDINPSSVGHTLIIPKSHTARVEDLSGNYYNSLFNVLYKLIGPICEAVGAESCTIGINNGPGSGQDVDHVHVHVIPRNRRDGGHMIQSVVRPVRSINLEEVSKLIKEKILLST